jgi:hypothetical protein
MKKLLLLFLILHFSILQIYSQPSKQYPRKEDRRIFYQKLSVKYNSSAIREILNSDAGGIFDKYVDGYSETQLVNSFSTVVHELLHGYNEEENGGFYYFIEPGIRCFVKLGKYYSSKELNAYVRKGQQDSIFRYPLYVGGNQPVIGTGGSHSGGMEEEGVSVLMGIYGLLEEYNAYYYGALSDFELFPYYVNACGENNEDGMKDYKHEVMSDITAYYEFNLFFGWYMQKKSIRMCTRTF